MNTGRGILDRLHEPPGQVAPRRPVPAGMGDPIAVNFDGDGTLQQADGDYQAVDFVRLGDDRLPRRPEGRLRCKPWSRLQRKGHGCAARPERRMLLTASISSSSIGMGVLPAPTMPITPGVVKMGTRRSCGSNRQNR